MATLKQRLHRKNSSGTYDTIHYETSSDVVMRPSGRSVEQDLAAYLPEVQNNDNVPQSLKASKLIVGLTKGFLRGKALSVEGHTHDDRYFTEAEINNLLSGKSPTNHNHDNRYYTEAEVNGLLSGKANSSHTHDASNITSGTLPVARGGTGVTTLNALKTLLGIDTSENSITKIVSGTYKGTATNKYDNATIQVITVSGINKIKFLIVSAMSSPPVLADSFGTDVITTWVYSLFGFASNTVSNNSSLVISSDNTFTVGSQNYNTSSHHSRLNIAQYMYMYFAFGT